MKDIKEHSRVEAKNRGKGTVQRLFPLCNGQMAAKVAWDDGTVSPISVDALTPLTMQSAVEDIEQDVTALLQKIGKAGVLYEEIHHYGFFSNMNGAACQLDEVVKDVLVSLKGNLNDA